MKQNVATGTEISVLGGNFCGVCRGLDQGDKFYNKNAYPKKILLCHLGLYVRQKRNTRERLQNLP